MGEPNENQSNVEHIPEEGGAEEMGAEEEYIDMKDQIFEEEVQEEDLASQISDDWDNIPKMKLPKDPIIGPVYNVYKPSPQLEKLKSEKRRTLFAEAFLIESEKEVHQVPKLVDLCMKAVLMNFRGGNLDSRIKGELRERFGENLDLYFPLENILDLDVTSYWKKVFLTKCKNKLLVCEKSNRADVDWKKLGIQEKFREMIETTSPESWNDIEMLDLAKKITPYIEELKITQLVPLPEFSIEKDPNLSSYKIYNYPDEDCHHINMEFLGEFKNLVSLHIEFQPPYVGYKYEKRFFLFSYSDMENIAR